MYTLLLVILIAVSFSVLGYLAITRLNARIVVASLFAFGLVWLCGLAVLAEPPTDNPAVPAVRVQKVGKTLNIFVDSPNASEIFVRLQNPDGTYLANFAIQFNRIGERSHAAFEPYSYFGNADYRAVVFHGNTPIKVIRLK